MIKASNCIFCGSPGGNHEHIFMDWFDKRHVKRKSPGHGVARQRWHDSDEIYATYDHRPKRLSATTAPVVCSNCNNGWMSEIENNASRLLKIMFENKNVDLSPSAEILSRWFSLKLIINDRTDSDYETISDEQIKLFFNNNEPLDGLFLYCGSYLGNASWPCRIKIDVKDSRFTDQFGGSEIIRSKTMTYVIENILFYGFISTDGLLGLDVKIPALFDLWPTNSERWQWPRFPTSECQMNVISSFLTKKTLEQQSFMKQFR